MASCPSLGRPLEDVASAIVFFSPPFADATVAPSCESDSGRDLDIRAPTWRFATEILTWQRAGEGPTVERFRPLGAPKSASRPRFRPLRPPKSASRPRSRPLRPPKSASRPRSRPLRPPKSASRPRFRPPVALGTASHASSRPLRPANSASRPKFRPPLAPGIASRARFRPPVGSVTFWRKWRSRARGPRDRDHRTWVFSRTCHVEASLRPPNR